MWIKAILQPSIFVISVANSSHFPQTVDWTCDLCVGGWDVSNSAYDLATVIK